MDLRAQEQRFIAKSEAKAEHPPKKLASGVLPLTIANA
jgi:hypothetical protein